MKHFNLLLVAFMAFVLPTALSAQDCNTAFPIGDMAGVLNYSDAGVSLDPAGAGNTDSTWYSFSVSENGYITINSCDAVDNPDTRLFLYDGMSCASINLIATSDNDCGAAALLNDRRVVTGRTYYLLWDNKSATTTLDFDVNLSFVADADYIAPANDDICDAAEIMVGDTLLNQSNEHATIEDVAEFGIGNIQGIQEEWNPDFNVHNTVWFTFEAPESGAAGIEMIGTAGIWDAQLAVFTGDCNDIAGLSFVAAKEMGTMNDPLLNLFCLDPGATYTILVDGFGTESGDFDISVRSIDLRMPYAILFYPDTLVSPSFACPGADDFELAADLVVAEDSSLINDVPTATAWDVWYQAALTEYMNAIDWELNDEDGSGAYAYDDDLGAGTYTATFDDGCRPTWVDSFTFEDDSRPELDVQITSTTNPGCVGESGSATFEVTGGFKYEDALTFSDDSVVVYIKTASLSDGIDSLDSKGTTFISKNSTFFTTALFQGVYRIIVEDGCGNLDSADFTMTNPTVAPLVVGVESTVNPFCPTDYTGEVNLFTSGGQNKPFVYTWWIADTATTDMPDTLTYSMFNGAPNFTGPVTSEDYQNAGQGWYMISVFDGCNQTEVVYAQVRDQEVDDLDVSAVATNPSTFAAQDGSIEITAAGGNGIYSSWWFVDGVYTPEMDDVLNATGLAQGIYYVMVEDTCSVAGSFDSTFVLLAPVANDEPCDAIVITEDDTLTTYHNQGATVAAGESTALGIPTDADEGFNGWEETGVQSSVWFSFEAPASGAVELSADAVQMIGNLSFDPQIAVFSGDCNDFNTFEYLAANDDVGGGFGNNSSYLEVYCLTPGATYYVLVDGFAGIGQEGYFSLEIAEIDLTPIEVNYTKANVSCGGLGSVDVSFIEGGVYMTSPEQFLYTVEFDGDLTTGVAEGDPNLTYNNLAAGTYTLTVRDTCGNTWTEDIVIEPYNPGALVIEFEVTSPTCPGGDDGIIDITYTNGAGGYNTTFEQLTGGFTTGGPEGGANPVFSSLTSGDDIDAGDYLFTVTDACGNVKQFEVRVDDPVLDPVVVTVTEDDPECPGELNGSITLDYAGGSGEYFLTVRTGNGATGPFVNGLNQDYITDASYVIDNLGDDQYFITVQDICAFPDTSFSDTVEVTDPVFDPLDIEVTEVNPSAPLASDGSFSFTIEGGAIPYTIFAFELDGMGNIVDTLDIVNQEVTGLTAGSYRLAVDDNCDNDANNFSGTVDFVLLDPPAADDACDAPMVAVGTTVTGDNTAATVQPGELSGLSIPNNVDCESFEGWCAANGIDASVWYKTVVPASGAFSVEVNTMAFDAQVALFTVGDTCSNFDSYELLAANDDKDASTDSDAYVEAGCLEAGIEVYILVDANTTSDAVNVEGAFTLTVSEISYQNLMVLGNVTNPSNEITNDGSINVQVTGGLAPFTYVWMDNGSLSTIETQDRSGLGVGTYVVTVTDACGNSASATFNLNQQGVSYDNVCDAVLLPVDGVTREFTNEGATLQTGEIVLEPATDGECFSNTDTSWCSGDGLDASIWFKFYAPASGDIDVDLCNGGNNTFDTQVAVYRSNTCTNFSAFTIVGANDDFPGCALGSVLNLTDLEPCALYYILVDTDDNQRGTVGIRLNAPNDDVNAGDDQNFTVCEEDGTIDLTTYLDPNADANGTFVDINNTGALTGSDFNAALVGEGTYVVEYRVSVECNGEVAASDVATLTITVEDCFVGIIESNEGQSFSLFPNPSNGTFAITTGKAEAGIDVVVTDYAGKEVLSVKDAFAKSDKLDLNVSGVASGVYAVRLSGNATGAFKVIIK